MSGRGRWVVAGAVLIVVVGAAAAWVAFERAPTDVQQPIGVVATGPMSVWPESPFDPPDAIGRAQERADAGVDRWRLDADEVVARVAKEVLGWGRVDAAGAPAAAAGEPRVVAVRQEGGSTPCATGDARIDVSIDRLGRRRGGVWSVVGVSSPGLRLPVTAGDTVAAGQSLPFSLRLPPDQHAAIGVRFVQRVAGADHIGCGDGLEVRAGVTDERASVTVPDPLFSPGPCGDLGAAGYVFAYATPTLTVQTGDPLLEPAAISDLSIVPVRLVPRGTATSTPS